MTNTTQPGVHLLLALALKVQLRAAADEGEAAGACLSGQVRVLEDFVVHKKIGERMQG
jgi:hypothetical protein